MPIDLSIGMSCLILFILLLLSTFFSAAETGMMSLNRYRLRHLAQTHKRAALVQRMLERPEHLLSIILTGGTFANICVSSVGTVLAINLFGETWGFTIATAGITLIVLIFAEVLPKTLAALYPERTSYSMIYPLFFLAFLLYPVSWLVSNVTNAILWVFGFRTRNTQPAVSWEELHTLVRELTGRHSSYQSMLLRILDLEKVTVNDIMIPRSEVCGVDLDRPIEDILEALTHAPHTWLPLYHGDLNEVVGVISVRILFNHLTKETLTKRALLALMHPAYFVPEHIPLHLQLLEFQRHQKRLALVVDEYGDVQGLITLDDLMGEIVGEFTLDLTNSNRVIHMQPDGSYLVDGGVNIRDLNRMMGWELPTSTLSKTLSGLVIEKLESIPNPGTCLLIVGYPVEVIRIKDNMVRTVRISAQIPLHSTLEDGRT